MTRGKLIKQIILDKCEEREKLGYETLQDSDIMDILDNLRERGITLTKEEMKNLGFD